MAARQRWTADDVPPFLGLFEGHLELHGLELASGVEKAFLKAKETRPYEDRRPIFLEGGEGAARSAPAEPDPYKTKQLDGRTRTL